MYAGPINGSLEISAPGLTVADAFRSRAPRRRFAPGAVTATPAAGGAVDLSWAPSGPSAGVAGYIVERSAAGRHRPSRSARCTPATTAVDQTPADGTYSYEVVAVATGSARPRARPGRPHPPTSDSTAPRRPSGLNLPDFINQANAATVPVGVQLLPSSQASDTITVTAHRRHEHAHDRPRRAAAMVSFQFNPTTLSDGNDHGLGHGDRQRRQPQPRPTTDTVVPRTPRRRVP